MRIDSGILRRTVRPLPPIRTPARRGLCLDCHDLFEQPRTWARRHGLAEPPDPVLAACLDQVCRDHARAHGSGRNTITRTRLALRIIQTLQTAPGEPFAVSEIAAQVTGTDGPFGPFR